MPIAQGLHVISQTSHTKPNAWIAAGLLLLVSNAGVSEAAVLEVANCNDSGPGSLRSRIAAAASGDTIDLAHLTCGRITLTSGEIEIPQSNLKLAGRSRDALTIDGNLQDRVFWHRGSGRLRLEHVSVAYGNRHFAPHREEDGYGGCIRSDGDLELYQTRVHHCTVFIRGFLDSATKGGGVSATGYVLASYTAIFANTAADHGTGGGIDARNVTLYRSQVYGNTANSGGGVYSGGATVTYSTVQGNRASDLGGGLLVGGPLTINKSTISGNVADNFNGRGSMGGGGIYALGAPNLIADSTISGNRALRGSAALFLQPVSIYNSTIAFNTVFHEEGYFPSCEGALNAPSLHLESTIAARNTCTDGPAIDIGRATSELIGADNLIERASIAVPPDTITANPRLGPLANNGGPTRTHKPACDSPVLNHGSNLLHHAYDQRGPGYLRVEGPFADIGAVEK
jgi:hypothetical protein